MEAIDILILKLNSEQGINEDDKLAISGILGEYNRLIKTKNENYIVEMSPENFKKYAKILSNQ